MHHLGVTGQRPRPEAFGLLTHPLKHVGGRVDHAAGDGVGHGLQHDQVAEPFQQIGGEAARIVARVDHGLHGAEQRRGVVRGERLDGVVDERQVGGPEQRQRALVGDVVAVGALLGTGQQLVEHRERVTRRSAAGADDQRIHGVVDLNVLLGADALKKRPHGAGRQQAERVVVRARADGRQHLFGFGGGEHEDQVVRRLLDDLEQRVEAGRGDHVRLVDDEDAVPRLGRRVERAVAQFAGVVHTAVAGRVEFDDVDVAGPVGRQRHARVAHAARRRRRPLITVERAGQDARRRRLTAAARTREQVRVVDPARGERSAQRLGDMLLPNNFGEGCRAVLAVESHG